MAVCSYFDVEAEIQIAPKSKTIVLTARELAGLAQMPLGAILYLIAVKAIKIVKSDELAKSKFRMSSAEILRVLGAVQNLPLRTFKGRKRRYWEALEGALKTAQVLS